MTLPEFLSAIRSLYNIDGYQLPELTAFDRHRFLRDPVRYLIAIAPDAQQEAIWREVSKRQRPVRAYDAGAHANLYSGV